MILGANSSLSDTPVFKIYGTGTYVSFTHMQFFFNTTLFMVNDTALLHLQYCNVWLGNAAVVVQTTTNSAGTGYGNEISFQTLPVALPTLVTTDASGITQTTVTSGGTVSNEGGATVTERGIVYGTITNPTTTTMNHKTILFIFYNFNEV